MDALVIIIIIILTTPLVTGTASPDGTSRLRKVPKFPVLPGIGWDNLQNVEKPPVFAFNFSSSRRTTADGSFLIPDNMEVEGIPDDMEYMMVKLSSKIIDWTDYTNLAAVSINADPIFCGPISGSFAYSFQHCKLNQVHFETLTTRVTARVVIYNAIVAPEEAILHSDFRAQLQEVIQAKKVGDQLGVDYHLQEVMKKYGTHVLTRVDAGGLMSQEDYIYRSFATQISCQTLKELALDRFHPASANASALLKKYEENVKGTVMHSYGGTRFDPEKSLPWDAWVASIPYNLAPVDRHGVPLHTLMSPIHFPHESPELLASVASDFQAAIAGYCNHNRHVGCMDPTSKDFNIEANVPGECSKSDEELVEFGSIQL